MNTPTPSGRGSRLGQSLATPAARYAAALALLAVTLAALLLGFAQLSLVNVAMLLLLPVVLAAVTLGRGPALLVSALAVLAFDLGFVPPRGSLSVDDAQYLIMLAVMLVIAVTITQFSGGLRDSNRLAHSQARRAQALYALAAALNASLRREQIAAHVAQLLQQELDARCSLLLESDGRLLTVWGDAAADDAAVRTVFDSGSAADIHDSDAAGSLRHIEPLHGATRRRGVLVVELVTIPASERAARLQMIRTVASLASAAVERLHFVEVAARAQAEGDAERLRNAVLASLSHDLRTPLSALYALGDAIRDAVPADNTTAREHAQTLCDETLRLNRMTENLLDLARLRNGPSPLQAEWVSLEEIIGATLRSTALQRGDVTLQVQLPNDLPWLRLDAVLMERALVNLVDNAVKHGGSPQVIQISAIRANDSIVLSVRNSGSRFAEPTPALLDYGSAADCSGRRAGTGLGLLICRRIVEAHGGRFSIANVDNAATARIELPLPTSAMPELPAESDSDANADGYRA